MTSCPELGFDFGGNELRILEKLLGRRESHVKGERVERVGDSLLSGRIGFSARYLLEYGWLDHITVS